MCYYVLNGIADLLTGIHVSSPRKFAHGEQRLRRCGKVIRPCTSPATSLPESVALRGRAGKFPDERIMT